MLEDIYAYDEALSEDEYYEGLIYIMGDVYPHLSEEEIEDIFEDMLDRMPDQYAESILDAVGNVAKSLGSGALQFAQNNPQLIQTGATLAGTAIGGPIGAQIGNTVGGMVAGQLAPPKPMPQTGKALAIMQNPQAQAALARTTMGIGGGTAPLTTNGSTNMIPVATYLRALIVQAQNALKELDVNNVIPAPAFSEALPNYDDIDAQAEWLAEELTR